MTAAREEGEGGEGDAVTAKGRASDACLVGRAAVAAAAGAAAGAARARFGAAGGDWGGRGVEGATVSARPSQGESVGFFIYPPNRSHCRYRCRRRRPRPALLPLRRHRWPDSCAIHSPSFPLSLLSLPLYDTDGLRQIRSTDGDGGGGGGGRVAAIPELNFDGRTDGRT